MHGLWNKEEEQWFVGTEDKSTPVVLKSCSVPSQCRRQRRTSVRETRALLGGRARNRVKRLRVRERDKKSGLRARPQ